MRRHQRRADDHAVRPARDGAQPARAILRRIRPPRASVVDALIRLTWAWTAPDVGRRRAGDPGDRDIIDEARGVREHAPADAERRWSGVARRMKFNPAAWAGRHSSSSASGGTSTTISPSTPAALASSTNRSTRVDVDRVVIAHQHNRRLVVGLARKLAHHVERLLHGLAGLQRADRGRLDRGAVGHRIGKRHAQLDHVGAGRRQAEQDLARGLAGPDRPPSGT